MSLSSQYYELPITTLGDGTAMVVIRPYSIFNPSVATAASLGYLPFAWTATGSSTTPYSATPTYAVSMNALQANTM